jgi:hypothetical protein
MSGDVAIAFMSDRAGYGRQTGPGPDLSDAAVAGDVTIAVTIGRDGSVYQVGELAPPHQVHDHASGNHRGVPFARKYDPSGTVAWTRTFGKGATDAIVNVAVDSTGTVYVAGHTSRGEGQESPDLKSVAYVRTFGPDGVAGRKQLEKGARYATATGVAVGPPGQIFIVGWTRGALPGMTANGPSDAFLGKVQR